MEMTEIEELEMLRRLQKRHDRFMLQHEFDRLHELIMNQYIGACSNPRCGINERQEAPKCSRCGSDIVGVDAETIIKQ